ncbi:hypothetical protein AMTR_s00013p00261200 [Amborella trichopoda]|uniref:Uncharacterized protein n=1 Tax=Amborella trichopoda TaxID=13333 RepID=W1PS68_AMBTC|nr:hypothetical protein AMTR_s00013p00261200 [Amborella trichopoda]
MTQSRTTLGSVLQFNKTTNESLETSKTLLDIIRDEEEESNPCRLVANNKSGWVEREGDCRDKREESEPRKTEKSEREADHTQAITMDLRNKRDLRSKVRTVAGHLQNKRDLWNKVRTVAEHLRNKRD